MHHRLGTTGPLGVLIGCLAGYLVCAPAWSADDDPITLHLFGPELPFMFKVPGGAKDFAWSEVIDWGDAGIGTITQGAGEVIGIDGTFYIADADDPTPRLLSDEMTPSGAVATFKAEQSLTIENSVDLDALQNTLDKHFVDTDTFVYMFRARATLASVEYQLAGPKPSAEIMEQIKAGDSQTAVTIGTPKLDAKNVTATLIGIRAPAYLNTVFEIPYHIHFLAEDKTLLGHITALEASNLEIEWARTDAINIRYWDTD